MANFFDKLKTSSIFHSLNVCRDMEILYPPMRTAVELMVGQAEKQGLRVAVFETFRSAERQTQLYAQGHTLLKTNGMHHFGVAADIVFLDGDGHFTWPDKNDPRWQTLGHCGRLFGLFWGGDWKGFRDCPHFQFIPGTTEAQGKIINGVYP